MNIISDSDLVCLALHGRKHFLAYYVNHAAVRGYMHVDIELYELNLC